MNHLNIYFKETGKSIWGKWENYLHFMYVFTLQILLTVFLFNLIYDAHASRDQEEFLLFHVII